MNTNRIRLQQTTTAFVLLPVVAAIFLLLPRASHAQIVLLAPTQACISHDLTSNDQVFSDVIWEAENSSSIIGATVVLSCGPFIHETLADRRADAQITLSVQSQTLGAGWSLLIGSASTNIAGGSLTAVVVATSLLSGNADLRLQTRFKGTNPDSLVAGEYRATVTGTITAN